MNEIILFTILMARIIPIIFLCPFLGGKSVISPVKIGLSCVLILILFPFFRNKFLNELSGLNFYLFILYIKEMIVGSLIGLIAAIPFYSFEAAGRLIDISRNVNIGEVLVPHLQEQASTLSNFNVQLGIIIFFLINGHRSFIEGVFNSFLIVPIFSFPNMASQSYYLIDFIIKLSGNLFIIALQLSSPAILSIFLVDLFMGVMNKISPQYNMFIFSLSIKGIAGIILFVVGYEFIIMKMNFELKAMLKAFESLMRLLHL